MAIWYEGFLKVIFKVIILEPNSLHSRGCPVAALHLCPTHKKEALVGNNHRIPFSAGLTKIDSWSVLQKDLLTESHFIKLNFCLFSNVSVIFTHLVQYPECKRDFLRVVFEAIMSSSS